jgi:polyisoprenoid-binding protein YceI
VPIITPFGSFNPKLKEVHVFIRFAALLAVALAVATPARAASYTVDPVHTSAVFRIKHFNTAFFYGRFDTISGSLEWDDANPAAAKFDITIAADSVHTGNEMREKHLKGPDFFDVGQYPTIRFVSTSLKKNEADDSYTLEGNLTLHGQTKPVTAKLTMTGTGKGRAGEDLIGFEATFTIKRSEFGMNYMLNGLSDEVQLMVGIEAKKQ